MANVVSSAIVNKPPPQAIANLLARRNKIHHLNPDTDETLLKLFNKDPGDSTRTAAHNQVTMPSRNYAMLTENSPYNPPSDHPTRPQQSDSHLNPATATANANSHLRPATATTNGHSAASTNGHEAASVKTRSSAKSKSKSKSRSKDGHLPIHSGEMDCGTTHRAAQAAEHGRDNDGGLDICIRVEIDQHDPEGRTESYGLTVPTLTAAA